MRKIYFVKSVRDNGPSYCYLFLKNNKRPFIKREFDDGRKEKRFNEKILPPRGKVKKDKNGPKNVN